MGDSHPLEFGLVVRIFDHSPGVLYNPLPIGIGLEADCGTERRYPGPTGAASWDDGVKRIVSMASGPHYEAFGVQWLMIAVVIRSMRKPSLLTA